MNATHIVNHKAASPRNRTTLLLLGLILLLAATLRFYHLGTESFSYDEGIMIDVTGSLDNVIANVAKGRPPLIVIAGYIWVNIFGDTEAATRSLSAVTGVISIWLLYAVGRDLFNKRVGLIAALLMSISIFHIFYSQDYRYYGLLGFTSLLSFYFYAKALKTERTIYFIMYPISAAAVFYAHYHGAFVLLAQGIYFLLQWYKYRPRTRLYWFCTQIAIVLLISPSIYRLGMDYLAGASNGDFSGSLGVLGNGGPLRTMPLWLPIHTLLIGYLFITIDNVLNLPYLVLSIGVIAISTLMYAWRQGFSQWMAQFTSVGTEIKAFAHKSSELILLGCWLLIPVITPFLISVLWKPIYMPRYTIGALPALCLIVALLLTTIRRVVPEIIPLIALAIMIVPGLEQYYTHDLKEQWPEVAKQITSQVQPDDGIVFVSINNEPAARIQSTFNRYFATQLPECLVDAGLNGPDQALPELNSCGANMQRIWFISRVSKDDDQATIQKLFFAPSESPWHIQQEQAYTGLVVRLLTPQ